MVAVWWQSGARHANVIVMDIHIQRHLSSGTFGNTLCKTQTQTLVTKPEPEIEPHPDPARAHREDGGAILNGC